MSDNYVTFDRETTPKKVHAALLMVGYLYMIEECNTVSIHDDDVNINYTTSIEILMECILNREKRVRRRQRQAKVKISVEKDMFDPISKVTFTAKFK